MKKLNNISKISFHLVNLTLILLYLYPGSIFGYIVRKSEKIKKNFFLSNGPITMKNVTKYISHMAPCIEIVGYRQRKKGIMSFGDLCSDFGANVKFNSGMAKIQRGQCIDRELSMLRVSLNS